MPSDFQSQQLSKVAELQHFVPPTARELRAQAVQRLQVGLFGLAAMLLIVGLASIINDQLRQSEAMQPTTTETGQPGNTDPLADIGVIPAADPSDDRPATKGN